MKKFLSSLALVTILTSVSFASFPVTNFSPEESSTTVSANKSAKAEKKAEKAEARITKKVKKIQAKLEKKAEKGSEDTTAIVLALISVLLLPIGLHNWYLGRKKQALWQTLLFIPGFILIIPAIISWIWQIVDLFRLLSGNLPQ